jgi:ABC-type transporter Mla subunit MlaD
MPAHTDRPLRRRNRGGRRPEAREGRRERRRRLFKEWKSVLAKYSSADLEHNLNARAVAGLKGEVAKVDAQVDQLVTELNRTIAEANCFISDTDTSAG